MECCLHLREGQTAARKGCGRQPVTVYGCACAANKLQRCTLQHVPPCELGLALWDCDHCPHYEEGGELPDPPPPALPIATPPSKIIAHPAANERLRNVVANWRSLRIEPAAPAVTRWRAEQGERLARRLAGVGVPPLSVRDIPPERLLPGPLHLNCSVAEFGGRRWLAYRVGWEQAEIGLALLGADGLPQENWRVQIPRQHWNEAGTEDPRLFVHDGSLWISCNGYTPGRPLTTTMAIARLDLDRPGEVAELRIPRYPARRSWEKNWVFFSRGGELFALYQSVPWEVLRIRGDEAQLAARLLWQPAWNWGTLRGGASPVLVGDEWFHFFHAVDGSGPERIYSVGVVAFAADPPFTPRLVTSEPLYAVDPADRPTPTTPHCVFPGGALFDGQRWLVALGYYDGRCRLVEWSADVLSL